jgi:hypothetical protein
MMRETPRSAPARQWSPAILEQELARVHAHEFARLLRAAALLRRSTRRELAAWLRAARQARALAEIDGFELPGLLRHALAHAPGEWAAAASLVEAALEQEGRFPW